MRGVTGGEFRALDGYLAVRVLSHVLNDVRQVVTRKQRLSRFVPGVSPRYRGL
jgi:hypothetical protein